MLNTFYALLGRMKYIDRWCLMRSSRPENLCEHTLETAYIAHALALLNRQRGGILEPEKAVLYDGTGPPDPGPWPRWRR